VEHDRRLLLSRTAGRTLAGAGAPDRIWAMAIASVIAAISAGLVVALVVVVLVVVSTGGVLVRRRRRRGGVIASRRRR
jgi:hypothetical protein